MSAVRRVWRRDLLSKGAPKPTTRSGFMSLHGMPDACQRRIHRSKATTEWASRPRPLVESPATTPTRCHSVRAAASNAVGCVPPRSRIRS